MKRIPTEQLVRELQQLAGELGRTPRADEMNSDGPHSTRTYTKRFGSWNEAVREAGLEPNESKRSATPRETLIENLRKLADELEKTPTAEELNSQGHHSVDTYQREFGSWNAALREVGLELNSSRDDYVSVECANCGTELSRKPSWAKRKQQQHYCDYECQGEWLSENNHGEDHPSWKGGYEPYYGPGWREKRQQARERDDYRCQRCGMAQADHIDRVGVKLHVHHIRPVREFDNRRDAHHLDNLVTLCAGCHRKWEGIPLRPQTTTEGDDKP